MSDNITTTRQGRHQSLRADLISEWRVILAHVGITASVVLVSAFLLTGYDAVFIWR